MDCDQLVLFRELLNGSGTMAGGVAVLFLVLAFDYLGKRLKVKGIESRQTVE